MNNNHSQNEAIRRLIESARRRNAEPHLRDILRLEAEEAAKRSREEALENMGPKIEEESWRNHHAERLNRTPRKNGSEIDMD
jgi:hypothetical protein